MEDADLRSSIRKHCDESLTVEENVTGDTAFFINQSRKTISVKTVVTLWKQWKKQLSMDPRAESSIGRYEHLALLLQQLPDKIGTQVVALESRADRSPTVTARKEIIDEFLMKCRISGVTDPRAMEQIRRLAPHIATFRRRMQRYKFLASTNDQAWQDSASTPSPMRSITLAEFMEE